MTRRRIPLGSLCLILACTLAGCGEFQPYVYKKDEFNRSSPDFNKKPEDIEFVEICYGTMSASAQEVKEIAIEQCGRFGKQPRLVDQAYGSCPMFTPVLARFECVPS